MFKTLEQEIKSSYNSVRDDISNEFYNKVLSEAVSYKRVSGYFSSKALSLYADGLDKLVRNNGRVQLLISQNISEKDFDDIQKGYEQRSENEALTEIDKLKLGNLAYLISIKKVDVKFGVIKNGLFHTKWGIFEDTQGDLIYFNGSLNETANGFMNNYDSFDVDFSWDISSNVRERIEQKTIEFELLWNDNFEGVKVIEASDMVYELLQDFDNGKINRIPNPKNNEIILTKKNDFFYLIDKTDIEVTNKKSFVSKLSFFIDEEKGFPFFRDDLSYVDVEKILTILYIQAKKNNFKVKISEEVRKFIKSQKFTIEEYRKAGLTLKDKDIRWEKEFQIFKRVVEKEIKRPLKTSQLEAAFYMFVQKRAANFSVPGSGKTAMLLGVFAYLNSVDNNHNIKRILVVCPLSAFMSWKDEFYNVFNDKKELKVLNIHDEDTDYNKYVFEREWFSSNLILINYESLPKYSDSILKCLSTDNETMIVYDEVHRVKGIDAKRAEYSLKISSMADYRYVLTGTPIPNGYMDVYNFLHILFGNEYDSFFGYKFNHLKNPNSMQIEDINKKLQPFYWRINKEDLKVPPADSDYIIKVKASEEQIRLAEVIYNTAKNSLVVWIRLIQLSTNPSIINQVIDYNELGFNEDTNLEKEAYDQIGLEARKQLEMSIHEATIKEVKSLNLDQISSPKFDAGIDLIIDLIKDKRKVIVWGLFVNTLKKITSELIKLNIKAEIIYGGTPKDEREKIINTFKKEDDTIQVLVSNPNTLGESISLHNVVHDAVYFEYNYNLTFMLQSRDRIHRLGLKDGARTRYHYLMTESDRDMYNFIDEKIYCRLHDKEEIMKRAIDEDYLTPEFSNNEIDEMKEIIESERNI